MGKRLRSTRFDSCVLQERCARFLRVRLQTGILQALVYPALEIQSRLDFFHLMGVVGGNHHGFIHCVTLSRVLQNNMLDGAKRHLQNALAERTEFVDIV